MLKGLSRHRIIEAKLLYKASMQYTKAGSPSQGNLNRWLIDTVWGDPYKGNPHALKVF